MAVPDESIIDAQSCIGAAGIGCEPASAASVAGTRAAIRSGLIGSHEGVVAILTGHVLKDPFPEGSSERSRYAPVEIDASLSAIENELGRMFRGG